MNLKKNKLGFTLVEVVVALGIFSIATTYAISIFVQSNQVQKRTANIQRILSDARYALEVMAREVRMGHIDYDYAGYDTQEGVLNLEQSVLALRDSDDSPVKFRREFLKYPELGLTKKEYQRDWCRKKSNQLKRNNK